MWVVHFRKDKSILLKKLVSASGYMLNVREENKVQEQINNPVWFFEKRK
jgi:hypothetical protein